MRNELEKITGKRIKVFAEIQKFGEKRTFRGRPKKTVCLINVRDESGNILCDHLWLIAGKQMEKLNLKIGDKISFFGRASEYEKGYKGYREDVFNPVTLDYRLSNPSKFEKISN